MRRNEQGSSLLNPIISRAMISVQIDDSKSDEAIFNGIQL